MDIYPAPLGGHCRKRAASESSSSDSNGSDIITSTHAPAHTSKFKRTDEDSLASSSGGSSTVAQSVPYTCSLPPLCNASPSTFRTSQELLSHYESHHAYVCSVSQCRKVFPDNHFLDLHIAEFHDPLVEIQREAGKKTYRCFVPVCSRSFSTPKTRRLHLVDMHKYPKEFYFALPMYGLEQLYAKFGDSTSLVRPRYDPSSILRPSHGQDLTQNMDLVATTLQDSLTIQEVSDTHDVDDSITVNSARLSDTPSPHVSVEPVSLIPRRVRFGQRQR